MNVEDLIAYRKVYEIRQDWTSQRCRKFRIKNGRSVSETAKTIGITQAYLSQLEMGQRKWNGKLISRFYEAVLKDRRLKDGR